MRGLPPDFSPRFVKPGVPTVDWGNPLARGLVGAYLPGLGCRTVRDLTGLGANLVCGTSRKFSTTPEGLALDTSAHGAGQGCNGIASPSQKPTKTASCFWRGILLGTPALNEYLFGVEFGDGNSSPFSAYDLVYSNGGTFQAGTNANSAAHSLASSPNPATNTVVDAATTVDMATTGTMWLYVNGAFNTSVNTLGTGTGSFIAYGASAQTQIGGTSSAGQNAANARHLVGYTWNRALTDVEVKAMHLSPYQLLVFPQDRVLASLRPFALPVLDDGIQPRPQPIGY